MKTITLPEIYSKKKWGRFKKWFRGTDRSNKILIDFFANPNMKGKLLDIGAWDGSLGKNLPKGVDYYPLDISKINHPNSIVFDLNKGYLPFKNKEFDFVIASMIIEHTLFPIKICKEIRRVLKDKGFAIIGLPNDSSPYTKLDIIFKKYDSIEEQKFQHHWNFTFKNAKDFLNKCGFKIVDYSGRFGITHRRIAHIAPIIFYKVEKKRR